MDLRRWVGALFPSEFEALNCVQRAPATIAALYRRRIKPGPKPGQFNLLLPKSKALFQVSEQSQSTYQAENKTSDLACSLATSNTKTHHLTIHSLYCLAHSRALDRCAFFFLHCAIALFHSTSKQLVS